jgi:uncharacterized protein YdhG (YjbR/CyaY superfamily)
MGDHVLNRPVVVKTGSRDLLSAQAPEQCFPSKSESVSLFAPVCRRRVIMLEFAMVQRVPIPEVQPVTNNHTVPQNIDDYIAGFPPDVQEILQKIRMTIREAAPDAKEAIAYRMPTFRLAGNLVHFAAFKNHIGFYPTPSGIEAFRNELSAYKTSKGAAQFLLNRPIPYDLIREIVTFRVKENLERANTKRKE